MRAIIIIVAALATTPALALSAKSTAAIKTVITSKDYRCDQVDKIIGPTATARGNEFSIHCGPFRYVMTISPQGRFYVRER